MGKHSKKRGGSPGATGKRRDKPKGSSADPKKCGHPGYVTKRHPTTPGKLAKCPHCTTEWFIPE